MHFFYYNNYKHLLNFMGGVVESTVFPVATFSP